MVVVVGAERAVSRSRPALTVWVAGEGEKNDNDARRGWDKQQITLPHQHLGERGSPTKFR